MALKSLSILVFTFSAISSAQSNSFDSSGEKMPCLKLVNKKLSEFNYGTFNHPRSGVNKGQIKDKATTFDSPGGPKVSISKNKIDTLSFAFGSIQMTTTTFDTNCTVTSVTVSSPGNAMGGGVFIKADKDTCTKPSPVGSFFEAGLLRGICEQNFLANKARPSPIKPFQMGPNPIVNPFATPTSR